MLQIGKNNNLKIVKKVDFGLYLDGGDIGEILLPTRYVPENAEPGGSLDVFIYRDSEDRIIATTETPFAKVGEFACLKVKDVNNMGAFLDWGLSKDLMVPFREQKMKMEIGKSYVVAVFIDETTNRIVASAKIDEFIEDGAQGLAVGQKVEILIYGHTELGYKAIINDTYSGILYKNEVFKPLNIGEKTIGYIKRIREDKKIDLSLTIQGYGKTENIAQKILNKLEENNGFLAVNDKSPAEVIYGLFGESKKAFKMAVGALYKQKLITIENDGIRINLTSNSRM